MCTWDSGYMFWILFFIIRLNNSCNSHWMYDKQKTLYCTLEFDFIRTVTVWFTIYMTGRKSQWLGGRHSWHFSDHHCLLLHHLCWVVSLQNHFQKNLEELIHICVLDHRSVHHQNWNVYTWVGRSHLIKWNLFEVNHNPQCRTVSIWFLD